MADVWHAEDTYHGTVSNLKRLDDVHHELSGLPGNVLAATSGEGIVHLPGEEDGLSGGREVWDDTSKTKVQGILGNVAEVEGVLDDSLINVTEAIALRSALSN